MLEKLAGGHQHGGWTGSAEGKGYGLWHSRDKTSTLTLLEEWPEALLVLCANQSVSSFVFKIFMYDEDVEVCEWFILGFNVLLIRIVTVYW